MFRKHVFPKTEFREADCDSCFKDTGPICHVHFKVVVPLLALPPI